MSEPAQKRILIIDGAQTTRSFMDPVLVGAGFDVLHGSTAADCRRLLAQKPDLLILDVQLPDGNGIELCSELKREPVTASLPILHVSATYVSGEDQAQGLEGGADGYLTYPMDPVVLVASVRAILRAKRGELRLQDTVDTLRMERQMREQFVATLTHDLRNPLSAAKVTAQLLGRGIIDPGRQGVLVGRIVDCINRIDQMVTNLLDANRIRAGERLPLDVEPMQLLPVLEEATEELTTVHGERFRLHCPPEIQGHWSRTGIRRMLDNLLQNAIKYGDSRGEVTVTARELSDGVCIEVNNRGNPIHPVDQARLFDPFHRSPSARASDKKGWGLGLTLVRGLAEAHGGGVQVESGESTGTTFRIALPLDSRAGAPAQS